MKKLLVSVVIIVAFTFYAGFSRGTTAAQGIVDQQVATTTGSSSSASQTTATSTPSTSTSAAASNGAYKDGAYTGSAADAFFGNVQVQAVIKNGKLTDVKVLSHPSGRRQSDVINNSALPVLTKEAVSAQSANVQAVSGATLSSRAFMESLNSALQQAA